MRTHKFAVMAMLLLFACKGEPEEPIESTPDLSAVLPNIPLPPRGEAVSREGSGNALQLVISTPMPGDSVSDYYRSVLSRPPYRLINEATSGNTVSFYVEQDGPPLWVAVQTLEGGGTLVRVAGAAIKNPAAQQPAPDSATPPTVDSLP